MLELLLAALLGQQPAAPPASPALDYEFYKARVEPLFLEKREGHARCVTCHGGSATLRLQRLPPKARRLDRGADPQELRGGQGDGGARAAPAPAGSCGIRCRGLRAATSSTAAASTGRRRTIRTGRCWRPGSTAADLASYTKRASATKVARIIQTNAAGDNIHLIDPATNKVVGVISDIEVPHGVTSAPDGTRMYFTNEALHTLDAVDAKTLAVIARVHLSGRPEQRRDHERRQARLRGHRAGARRRRRDRHRRRSRTRRRFRSRARSTTSTSRPTASTSCRDRFPDA